MLSSGIIKSPSGEFIPFLIKTKYVQPEQALRDAARAYARTPIGKRLAAMYGGITARVFIGNPPPFEFLSRFGIRRLTLLPICMQLSDDTILASDESKEASSTTDTDDSNNPQQERT